MNKYELAKKITQLDGLTNEEKASLVELLRSQKKYGLVWEDKPEEIETRLVDELPVLTEVTERAIVSDAPDAPNHILIEGDNLEALTALAYTHEGKIDVIYIDPPYNTGNKDFVYNDSFVDREDGYRHSKWLSFMNKRLQIAKSLLSSGGVIFISIDDNEQAQLKLLCDETLGNNNFLGMITRATGTTTGQDTGSLGKACDYILVYSKQDNYKIGGIPLSEKDLSRYSLKDKKGNFSILQLRRTGGEDRREDRPTMFFPIQAPDGSDVYPYGPTGYESRWRVGPQKVLQMLKDDLLYFKKDKNGNWKVYYKFYSDNKTKRPSNLWTEVDGNKKAQIELKNVVPDVKFETPKPLDLIMKILQITSSKKSTVLDFFAGSGTTLHATMQLNAEDGGHRKCILVTNNENNICEEVTYERNKRVIQGYTTPKGEDIEGLHDNNLRYYRTTLLSRDKSVKNMRQLVRLATDMLCIKNDVYTEAEFCGKKINPNIARYFDNGQGNRMLVIYEERAIQLLVQLMAQTEDDGIKTMVYVFSPGADPYTDDFEDVAERVKLCALPSAIYEAYKRVLPKRKPKFLDEALQEMKAQAEAEANAQQTLDFGENDNMNEEGGEA
ncbi:site-specific DNA-methyltransferase [Leyella stercorea]|uniref:site-specific DNA-methyltransferase n=1 Tax=Leyella stercorea TaxID=363265 RepID=UPI001F455991|nr:site-specific DNA-methyltransferase [Leyella stercorea]MCF2614659.1 site-specific DNA-methyltransferase [Leyella stercorea]